MHFDVKKQRRQRLEALPTRVHGKVGCLLSDFEDWLNFRQQWVDIATVRRKKWLQLVKKWSL